jgi:uncharacterized protein with HEPN domain
VTYRERQRFPARHPWTQIARMCDHLAHRYFDTDHAGLQATVDNDLPELERAVQALAATLPAEDQQEENPPVAYKPSGWLRHGP